MSKPRPKLGLIIKPLDTYYKDYLNLWSIYEPLLSIYYNVNQYIEDVPHTVDGFTSHGGKKSVTGITGRSGWKYVCALDDKYKVWPAEAESYFKILLKFLQLKDERGYRFNIPKIYKSNNDLDGMVFDRVIFSSSEQNATSKSEKYDTLKNMCVAQGQFIDFMFNECNITILDVESYVDDQTGILNFIDFGEVKVIALSEIKTHVDKFIKLLLQEELAIKQRLTKHKLDVEDVHANDDITAGFQCILAQIRQTM